MGLNKVDTSLCIGFYIKHYSDFKDLSNDLDKHHNSGNSIIQTYSTTPDYLRFESGEDYSPVESPLKMAEYNISFKKNKESRCFENNDNINNSLDEEEEEEEKMELSRENSESVPHDQEGLDEEHRKDLDKLVRANYKRGRSSQDKDYALQNKNPYKKVMNSKTQIHTQNRKTQKKNKIEQNDSDSDFEFIEF